MNEVVHAVPRPVLAGPSVRRRVLITLGIASLYVVLQNAWLAVAPLMSSVYDPWKEADWPREAAQVASAARTQDAALPSVSRGAAWQLGYLIGSASHWVGSSAASGPEPRTKAMELVAPKLQAATQIAQVMGIGDIAILQVATASDFLRENERIETDELGIATRVETHLSVRHRHLFLLGMHVGVAMALAEGSRGQLHNPNRLLIGRHATLAAVPASAWDGVTRRPEGATPADTLKAYLAAVVALDAAIGKLEALP